MNIVDLMRNNKTITATVYRGANMDLVYGPTPVCVDLLKIQLYPETYGPRTTPTDGDDIPSHNLYLKPLPNVEYSPLLEDYVIIEQGGGYDGPYVVKQYSMPDLSGPKYGQCYTLVVRFLGAKKPGDEPKKNNSANLRLGGRSGL